MPALVFDTCCGCINLRTGSLIIGYLQLVAEIILALMLIIVLGLGGAVASGAIHADNEKDQVQVESIGVVLVVVAIIMILALILALAFTITLLVGIHKNKRGHVKAYIVYASIFLVLSVIMFFVSLSNKNDAGSIVGNIIGLLINFYFLLVIRSYYHQMDNNKPAVFNTA